MTVQTRLIGDAQTLLSNLDRVRVVLKRKRLRMEVSILSLRQILTEKRVRHVAISTHGHGMMTRLLPAIVLRLHDVTVHARFWIRGEIRIPLGIVKGRSAKTEEDTKQHTEEKEARDDRC